jgi:DNA-binding CsgD family transcriptional regulator
MQIGNGLTPEEARQAVMETAGELAATAAALRRLARLPARERAALARLMAGRGMGTQEIATRLGVSAHSAWNYQHGRRGDGQPGAPG